MCSRWSMGDLIWMSWCPVKNKTTRIGHGSQAILMTAAGFASIQRALHEIQIYRGHIDLKLQEWLRAEGEAERAHACCLYPPIGSYTEHASECDPVNFGGDKTRKSGFDSGENPCHGCRRSGDPKGREKYVYQWRGQDWAKRECWKFESDSDLHDGKKYWWKTFVEPTAFGDHLDGSGDGVGQPKDYAGMTERQKRNFGSWRKANSKRCFLDDIDEAHCVCMLEYSRRTCGHVPDCLLAI